MRKENAVVIFEDYQIRKIEKDGQIWIAAIDIAKALEYRNPSVAVSVMVDRNSDRFEGYLTYQNDNSGQQTRKMAFLNLKGVIAFCMLSKQKKAVEFQRWADAVLEKEILNIPKEIRIKAARKRIEFTDTLKEHGYKKPVEYATTTKNMKRGLGIDENKPKSSCDLIEVMKIATAEMLAKTNIMISEANGFNEIDPLCVTSAKAISESTKQIND